MANYIATDLDLESVADAIRNKGGTSADLVFPGGFVDAIDAISGGSGELPKTTYVHAESWQSSSTGTAATFVPAYFSNFTEPGLYVAIMSNNSDTSNYKAYAAMMWKAVGSDGRTAYLFDRPRNISSDSSSSTWFYLAAGTQIDIYFIAKELFA